MMSKTAAEPLVRISKREGATFVQKCWCAPLLSCWHLLWMRSSSFCYRPEPHQRVRRYVEWYFYEHHPFLLGAA